MAQKIVVEVSINLLNHASAEDIALLKARVTDAVDQAAGLEVISDKKFQEIYGGQEVTSDVRELESGVAVTAEPSAESSVVNAHLLANINSTETVTDDPYPWLFIDHHGIETRTHTAHEDGVDENGYHWEGWVYAPRPKEIWSE